VLDTSALIAALRSSKGAASEVVRLILRQRIVLLLDYKLACEYRDVIFRPEHLSALDISKSEAEELIKHLEDVSEPVEIIFRNRPMSVDPDDDMVLDVAINGLADVIVTNNIRHFHLPARRFKVQVLTPREFLLKMAKENDDEN
jgi:putative PIN family toxin of toxin-antitoxin system